MKNIKKFFLIGFVLLFVSFTFAETVNVLPLESYIDIPNSEEDIASFYIITKEIEGNPKYVVSFDNEIIIFTEPEEGVLRKFNSIDCYPSDIFVKDGYFFVEQGEGNKVIFKIYSITGKKNNSFKLEAFKLEEGVFSESGIAISFDKKKFTIFILF